MILDSEQSEECIIDFTMVCVCMLFFFLRPYTRQVVDI
jgi:hypothetical protein